MFINKINWFGWAWFRALAWCNFTPYNSVVLESTEMLTYYWREQRCRHTRGENRDADILAERSKMQT